jgi:hypothetical protein
MTKRLTRRAKAPAKTGMSHQKLNEQARTLGAAFRLHLGGSKQKSAKEVFLRVPKDLRVVRSQTIFDVMRRGGRAPIPAHPKAVAMDMSSDPAPSKPKKPAALVASSAAPKAPKSIFVPLSQAPAKIFDDTKFDAFWRQLDPGTDELFSTSTMRELLKGIVAGGKPLSKGEVAQLDKILAAISAARMPTSMSGNATEKGIMQHPAPPGKGLFGDPFKSAAAHAEADRKRKEVTLEAMKDGLTKKKQSGKINVAEIVRAGLLKAVTFTLDNFTAPIASDSVLPFTPLAKAGPNDPRILEQNERRERLKALAIDLGGKQKAPDPLAGGTRRSRQWSPGARSGSVSPPRNK